MKNNTGIVTIKVTSETGNERIYTLNVTRELSNEDIEKLYNTMQDIDGSIFNEDLNDWTYNNLEV